MNQENFTGEDPEKMGESKEGDNKESEDTLEAQLENEQKRLKLLESLAAEIEAYPVEDNLTTEGK